MFTEKNSLKLDLKFRKRCKINLHMHFAIGRYFERVLTSPHSAKRFRIGKYVYVKETQSFKFHHNHLLSAIQSAKLDIFFA